MATMKALHLKKPKVIKRYPTDTEVEAMKGHYCLIHWMTRRRVLKTDSRVHLQKIAKTTPRLALTVKAIMWSTIAS